MKKLILVVVTLFIFGCATSNEENHAGAYYSQGVDWENKGDYERAIANYSKAIEIDPKLPVSYKLRARLYEKKSRYDKAISDYTQAIELNPKDAEAFNKRGLCHFQLGQFEKVCPDLKQACELGLCESYEGLKLMCK